MTILIETTPAPGARLRVMTYLVRGDRRRPLEPVVIDLRREALRERETRFDRWSRSGADEVTAGEVPGPRQ